MSMNKENQKKFIERMREIIEEIAELEKTIDRDDFAVIVCVNAQKPDKPDFSSEMIHLVGTEWRISSCLEALASSSRGMARALALAGMEKSISSSREQQQSSEEQDGSIDASLAALLGALTGGSDLKN